MKTGRNASAAPGSFSPASAALDQAVLERAVRALDRPFACGLLAQILSM